MSKSFSRKVYTNQVFAPDTEIIGEGNLIKDVSGNYNEIITGTKVVDVALTLDTLTVGDNHDQVGDNKLLDTVNDYIEEIGGTKNVLANAYIREVTNNETIHTRGDTNKTYGDSPGSGNNTIKTYYDDFTEDVNGAKTEQAETITQTVNNNKTVNVIAQLIESSAQKQELVAGTSEELIVGDKEISCDNAIITTAGNFDVNAGGNAILNAPGGLAGLSGSVISLSGGVISTFFSIPGSFANNAAAVGAGLGIGDLYYTNVAGDGVVKVVL